MAAASQTLGQLIVRLSGSESGMGDMETIIGDSIGTTVGIYSPIPYKSP